MRNPITTVRDRIMAALISRVALATTVKYGGVPMSSTQLYQLFSNASALETGVDYSQPYARHPHVYRAITVIADSLSTLPLVVSRQVGDRLNEVTSGIEWETLRAPSWDMSQADLLGQTAGWMQTSWGEAFWHIVVEGSARSIVVLPASQVTVLVRRDGTRVYDVLGYGPEGASRRLDETEVIHFKRAFNPYDPIRGLGPLTAAALSYRDDMDVRAHNRSLIAAGGVPPGVLVTDKDLPDDADIMRVQAMMTQALAKGRHTGQRPIPILGGGLKWQTISVAPQEVDFLERSKQTPAEIGQCFGVPPSKMGDYQRDQADAKVQERDFWNDTMLPLAATIAGTLQNNLWKISGRQFRTKLDDGWVVSFNTTAVPALILQRQELEATDRDDVAVGIRTINEVREARGLEPVAWGDVWWAQGLPIPITSDDPEQVGLGGPSEEPATPTPPPTPPPADEPPDEEEPTDTQDAMHEWIPKARPRLIRGLSDELIWNAYAMQARPHELQMRRAIVEVQNRMEREVIANIRKAAKSALRAEEPRFEAVYGGNGNSNTLVAVKASPQVEHLLFDLDEFSELMDEATSPLVRAALEKGGKRGLRLARRPATSFHVDAAPAAAEMARLRQRFARPITATTWRRLQAALAQAFLEGAGESELTKVVQSVMQVRRVEAARTARTEAHAAFAGGTDLGFIQSEVVQSKIWVTAGDEHVREEPMGGHVRANGQEVLVNGTFSVGGEELKYPGDPSGSAGNVIECRCAVMPGKIQ